ncbi:MAG: ECF-type sigma factor [Planctomycetota bacterium]
MEEQAHRGPAFERIYDELRGLAQRRLRQGLGGASLQATALVHEVWLRLAGDRSLALRDSSHYYATAAQAMRWILVDRARRRVLGPGRRGPDDPPVDELPEASAADEARDREILRLDEALGRLERSHPRKAQVVLHRHFAGLSVEETAEALSLSAATVKREWAFARAWLLRELRAEAPPQEGAGGKAGDS